MQVPIAHSADSLQRFLNHIHKSATPKVVTPEYLRQSGFNAHNDTELRHIFQQIGFLDDVYRPTQRWNQYKTHQPETLQTAIYECYSDLFKMYPKDPYNFSDQALRIWFKPPQTGTSKSSIDRAIRTFRRLCRIAGLISTEQHTRIVAESSAASSSYATSYSPDKTKAISIPLIQIFFVDSTNTKTQITDILKTVREAFYE